MTEWLMQARMLINAHLKTPLEILLLAAVIYYLLMLLRGTRGAAVFMGLAVALIAVSAVTRLFEFHVINWLLTQFLGLLAIAVLVIFQPELRRLLADLGSQYLFGTSKERGELIDVLVETARSLSQKKCGAIMVIEREVGFRGIAEHGVAIGAKATPELLSTIFFPNTPLHDGGVILRGDQVLAAACIFPLTQRDGLSPSLGTRHRAAIGITEESDAVAVVVSEETGDISVAHRGHLVRGLDPDGLRAFLSTTLIQASRPTALFTVIMRKLLEPLPLFRPMGKPGNMTTNGFSDERPSALEPPRRRDETTEAAPDQSSK